MRLYNLIIPVCPKCQSNKCELSEKFYCYNCKNCGISFGTI